MLMMLLQPSPAHAWLTIGLSSQESQPFIGRKMPGIRKVGQIDSPEVSVDAMLTNESAGCGSITALNACQGYPAERLSCELSRHLR